MILEDYLYRVESHSESGYLLSLIADCPVYAAHFPGMPITPGVCIVQIVKELAEKNLRRLFTIKEARNVKFLSLLTPECKPVVSFGKMEKSHEGYSVIAKVADSVDGSIVYANVSLLLKNKEKEGWDVCKERMRSRRACVIIPVYNCESTVGRVIRGVKPYCDDIIVVDDGSRDDTAAALEKFGSEVTVVTHPKNRGKGAALKSGFKKAKALGFAYAVTIDGDGQHNPEDIATLVQQSIAFPDDIIMGVRKKSHRQKASSRFANGFANFWFTLYTQYYLHDTQSGYRLYPLRRLPLWAMTSRYEAELALLVISAWRWVRFEEVRVGVHYPHRSEQRSHFKPLRDFGRISILNTLLFPAAILVGLPSRVLRVLYAWFRVIYAALAFLLFSIFVIKPYTCIRGGNQGAIHKFIYRTARFVMTKHRIPGVKFSSNVAPGTDFDKPVLYICNHQSALDLISVLTLTPNLVFLANRRVMNNSFYGRMIRKAGYLNSATPFQNLVLQARDAVKKGYSLAVFPEGTRSETDKIERFHRGAFQIANALGLDVVPIVLYGPGKVFPKGAVYLRRGFIHVEVLPCHTAAEMESYGTVLDQASYMRKMHQKEYNSVSDKVDAERNK